MLISYCFLPRKNSRLTCIRNTYIFTFFFSSFILFISSLAFFLFILFFKIGSHYMPMLTSNSWQCLSPIGRRHKQLYPANMGSFFVLICFTDRISCSPGWTWTQYVTEMNLNFWSSYFYLQNAGSNKHQQQKWEILHQIFSCIYQSF